MRFTLLIICLFILSSKINTQEISIYQQIYTDSLIRGHNMNGVIIRLSDEEKRTTCNAIINHWKSKPKTSYKSVYNIKEIINTTKYPFKYDSSLLEYQTTKLNTDGTAKFNDEGEAMYEIKIGYSNFSDCHFSFITNEKWSYESGKFIKLTSNLKLVTLANIDSINTFAIGTCYSNTNDTSKLNLFKSDIVYSHYFYQKYYSKFLNNDSILRNPDFDMILLGTRTSEETNQYEWAKLKPLFDDIFLNKLKIYQIDKNSEISSKSLNAKNVAELYWIDETTSLDENGEVMFDAEGNEIILTTKTPIIQEEILGIEFHEDWYLGINSLQIQKRVKGIVLIIGDYDDNYVLRGRKKIPVYISFE